MHRRYGTSSAEFDTKERHTEATSGGQSYRADKDMQEANDPKLLRVAEKN